MRAFPEGAAQKADILRRLDEAAEAGRFPRTDEATSVGLMACLSDIAEPRAVEAVVGIPGGLALLADESVGLLSEHPADARALAREWVGAPPPGADLSTVPGAMVLWLIDQAAVAGASAATVQMPPIFEEVRALHVRAAAGETIERAAWSAARARALAATDEEANGLPNFIGRLAETLAWPALSSRTILVEATRIFAELRAMAAHQGAGGSPADDDDISRTMDALFKETAAERDADPENFSFPDVFAARHPDMSARFVARLEAGNAAFTEAFCACVRQSALLMRAAPVA